MRKIKMMIAGTANPHIPGYLKASNRNVDMIEIAAVSDFDETRLATVKGIPVYRDYQEMFEKHPEAEAVIIGSDNIDHYQMFLAAVEKKLHIYMMKVISMDEAECLSMIEIGNTYDRVVQCELELHFNPQFQYAHQLMRSGELGEIKSIYLTNVSQSPCNYFPNWGDPVLSYGKRVPIRSGAKVFRGGAITDHPHPYDLIRWLTGREFRSVKAVSARNQRAHLEVEDHAAITGELDDGSRYFVNPSYSNLEEKVPCRRLLWPKSLECNLKITGTKGYFACDYFDRHAYIVGNNCASPDRLIVNAAHCLERSPSNTLMGSFVESIEGKRSPESTLADSYAAVKVMNAAYESIYHDKTVCLVSDNLLE
jgi:predicted dehydrogenase